MFSLCFVSVSFAGIKNVEKNTYEEEDNIDNISVQENTENKINVYENKKKKSINVEKYYSKAKSAYWQGNMNEAQVYLDAILNFEDHQKAYELRNKIILLEEKEAFFKKEIVNNYSIELKRTLKESNYYEGFLFLNKILTLSPNENILYSKSRLEAEKDATLQLLDTKEDKNLFKKSIDCFVKEEYTKSKAAIEKLSQKYPRFLIYKGVAECYQIEEDNNKRIQQFYKYALNAAKSNHMYKAKNYIELAYGINRNNIKVLILMEQINMELMM